MGLQEINYIADTNILIYISKQNPLVTKFLSEMDGNIGISVITHMEFIMGIDENEMVIYEDFLNSFIQLPLSKRIGERVVEIFKSKKIKSLKNPIFADTVIGATAEFYNLPLITNNPEDFKIFKSIELIQPKV